MSPSSRRAWIEIASWTQEFLTARSPSSRRAWIEMSRSASTSCCALASPSSRRAWIEILQNHLYKIIF